MMFNLFKKEEEEEEIAHNWELYFSNLSKDHKQKEDTYKCKDCNELKYEWTPVIKPREAQIE